MVLRNTWWGIDGGFEVDILYVYNEDSKGFKEELPSDTQQALEGGSAFSGFPFYKTVGQNGFSQFTQLTNAQVNLLAASAEFSMWSARTNILDMLQ